MTEQDRISCDPNLLSEECVEACKQAKEAFANLLASIRLSQERAKERMSELIHHVVE